MATRAMPLLFLFLVANMIFFSPCVTFWLCSHNFLTPTYLLENFLFHPVWVFIHCRAAAFFIDPILCGWKFSLCPIFLCLSLWLKLRLLGTSFHILLSHCCKCIQKANSREVTPGSESSVFRLGEVFPQGWALWQCHQQTCGCTQHSCLPTLALSESHWQSDLEGTLSCFASNFFHHNKGWASFHEFSSHFYLFSSPTPVLFNSIWFHF